MNRTPACLLRALVCLVPLALASTAEADPCGELGPRGQPRVQLKILNCLTAIATVSEGQRKALASKVERGFREVYLDLAQQPLLDDEAAAWVELYRLSARFYPRKEELTSDIPIAFVNGHHYAIPLWVERSLTTPLGSLIHFDTHSDMEPMPRANDVLAAIADLKAGRHTKRAWHILAHSAHRNAMPVTGAVLAAGVRDVIWAKPGWATEPVDFVSRAFFYARPKGLADPRPLEALEALGPAAFVAAFKGQTTDFFMLHYDPADNENRWLPRREREPETWQVAAETTRPHPDHFEHITPVRLSVLTLDRPGAQLGALVGALSGETFVLDIDLDYFANAGAGADSEPSDDPASPGERAVQRREEPESAAAIFNHRNFRAAAAAEERRVIERRIRRFREALRTLKKAGKRPTIVTIADSANLPFSTAKEGQEHADFLPAHHAYWVHERVVAVLREIYGDGRASGLGDGPREGAQAASQQRKDTPVIGEDHAAFEQVRTTIRDALYSALAWAAGAATTYQKSPQLSAYLAIIHAIASHGPDAGLRRAARAVGEVHARLTLDVMTLGPTLLPTRAEVDEALRRVTFGQRYGSTEAEVARAGVRWFAAITGLAKEPQFDAESTPLPPSEALQLLGLRRVFAGGLEPNLCDVFLGSQATDGGFTIAEIPPLTRALYGLVAVRGILGLLPTAPVPAPAEDEKPRSEGSPFGQADVRRAALRGVAFALVNLGELPGTEPAIDGLMLLRTASQLVDNDAASSLARVAGKLLAGRIASKASQLLSGLSEAEQISAFAELGRALAHFGVDVSALRSELTSQAKRFTTAQVLGSSGKATPTYGDAFRALARAGGMAEFGMPIDYGEVLQRALPLTATATLTTEPDELIDRFNAVAQLAQTASGFRKTKLSRANFPGEWAFLESVFDEVMGSRRIDMTAALLETRRILGDDPNGPRLRDLTWQVLHEQNQDGSWGRKAPEDQRLRSTWAAVAALGDLQEATTPPAIATVAAALLQKRAAAAPVSPRPQAGTPSRARPGGGPSKPGAIIGRRAATAPGATPRILPPAQAPLGRK